MSDAFDRGFTVTEIAAMDQSIDASPETTAAFVGRALRGPLNTPVLIHHFGEFRRRFGDTWTRSSLGPAVQQFFEHGGKRLYVVRVANSARAAMICLPASGSALVMRAVEPGSTERVRAAVDFDGIDDDNDELFNLTLQRVDPATGRVADQEIFKRLSYREDAENFVADLLLSSTIARVEHPYPLHRPDPTINNDNRYELTWVGHAQDGTDGTELSDYDLIGSKTQGSGLFALESAEHFDLLHLPAPGKNRDAGPAAVLAAEQYCRRRGAMLLVDPPAAWSTADEAVEGMRAFGFSSPNMLSYFPRIRCSDKEQQARAASGAFAGLLAKQDRTRGPWHALDPTSPALDRGIQPAYEIDAEDFRTLKRAGLNVIAPGVAGQCRVQGDVTLARGGESDRLFASLSMRRLCLRIINSIDLATRWAVFARPDHRLTERIRAQVMTYLFTLADLGAMQNSRFTVHCELGQASPGRLEHGVTILLHFHPTGSTDAVSFTLHQTVAGCRATLTAFAPVAEDCA